MKRSQMQGRLKNLIAANQDKLGAWELARVLLDSCEEAGMKPPFLRTSGSCLHSWREMCNCQIEVIYGWEAE